MENITTAYVISEVEIIDPLLVETYRSMAQATIAQYGGRYIVRGAVAATVEGSPPVGSIVIVEFPDMQRAREWYNSPEYSEALNVRATALRRRLMFVDGV